MQDGFVNVSYVWVGSVMVKANTCVCGGGEGGVCVCVVSSDCVCL